MVFLVLLVLGCAAASPISGRRDPMINEGLFEGDIYGISPSGDRNAVPLDSQLWPGGIVPYVISETREDIRDIIQMAMKHIENHSCLRFKERDQEKDYVKIVRSIGCFSAWGRKGGEQPLSLGKGCESFAIALHELMHAIGFEHEHNRSDRDEHLIINWDNIVPQWFYAFQKLRPDQNRLLTPFDMSSIMLYGSRSFAKEHSGEKYSMVFRDGRVISEVYDRKSMSILDAERINILYKCPSAQS